MGEQHRLGVLHVGASGHDRVPGLLALGDQRVDQVEREPRDAAGVAAQPHADQAGDLVVARTPRTQLAAQFVPGDLQQATLQRRGLVLVVLDRRERPGVHTALQLVEGLLHAVELVRGQQAGTAERPRMGARSGDVVVGQTPVELGGFGESGELGRRTGGEPAAPQGKMFVLFSHMSTLIRVLPPAGSRRREDVTLSVTRRCCPAPRCRCRT